MLEAKILGINVSPRMGESMRAVETASLSKDRGIDGDRYANGSGAFSKSKRENVLEELREATDERLIVRDISFIALEAIYKANSEFGTDFTFFDTRRNILIEGIPDLTELVGVIFTIGSIALLGIEACDPCDRPSKLSGKDGFKEAFDKRGGLRARILEDGEIVVGDKLMIKNR